MNLAKQIYECHAPTEGKLLENPQRKGKNINMIQRVAEYAVEDKYLFSLEGFLGPWKACPGHILTF